MGRSVVGVRIDEGESHRQRVREESGGEGS